MSIIWLILAGVVSGIIGGMGMGGGTLLIPILTIFLSFEQINAQAINLISFIPMSFFALIIHIKNKLVDFRVGVPVMLSGIIFSIGGSLLASILSSRVLKKIFAIFLLVVGVNQLIQTFLAIKKKKSDKDVCKFKLKIFIK